jgi:LacI family transcriptional regulator
LSVVPAWDLARIRASGFFDAAPPQRDNPPAPVLRSFLVSNMPLNPSYSGSVASTHANIQSAVDALLAASPRPKGLFVSRDAEAVRVSAALATRGVQPGQDIIIVSCDNETNPAAETAVYPTATIDLNPEEVGRRALLRLLQRIAKPEEPIVQILVLPRLVTAQASGGAHQRPDTAREETIS